MESYGSSNENIEKEIELAKLMGNENIGPKVYDYYMCKKSGKLNIYIVMEYMDLGTLHKWLETNKLSKSQEKELMDKIKKMHNKVVHKDLHLQNILVKQGTNKKIEFYISDFGLSNTFQNLVKDAKDDDFKRLKDSINYQMNQRFNELISKLFVSWGLI